MTTVFVWLLISLPGCRSCTTNVPAVTIARFADQSECERVRDIVLATQYIEARQQARCIQARIIP